MRQNNPPRGSLKSLVKTLARRGDATQDLLRDYHRSFERRYTRRHAAPVGALSTSLEYRRPFIVPSLRLKYSAYRPRLRTKSWQPRRKQNIQGRKKQIHMALRFHTPGLGSEIAELKAYACKLNAVDFVKTCVFSCVHLRSFLS